MRKVENMGYRELQSECARLGLNGKGSREVLCERLDRFIRGDADQKTFVGETDNSDISPDEVVAKNPTIQQSQNLIPNEYQAKSVEYDFDWDKIKRRLDIIFAGRVHYFLQENSPPKDGRPGNYSIVFKGLARQSECINVTAGLKTIEREALKYVSRTEVRRLQGGDTPEEAAKKFKILHPEL